MTDLTKRLKLYLIDRTPFWVSTRWARNRWLWDWQKGWSPDGIAPHLYFGDPQILLLDDDGSAQRTPTPVRWPCLVCLEKVQEGEAGVIVTIHDDSGVPRPVPVHEPCARMETEGGKRIVFHDDEVAMTEIDGVPVSEAITHMKPTPDCVRCGHKIEPGELAVMENIRFWDGVAIGDSVCEECIQEEIEENETVGT